VRIAILIAYSLPKHRRVYPAEGAQTFLLLEGVPLRVAIVVEHEVLLVCSTVCGYGACIPLVGISSVAPKDLNPA
jgi:hypothetical protein